MSTSIFPPLPHAPRLHRRDSAQDPDVTTGTSFRSRKHANGVVDGVFMTKSDSPNPRQLGENPGRSRCCPGTLVGEHIQGPTGWGMGRWPGDRGLECGIARAANRRSTDSGHCRVRIMSASRQSRPKQAEQSLSIDTNTVAGKKNPLASSCVRLSCIIYLSIYVI